MALYDEINLTTLRCLVNYTYDSLTDLHLDSDLSEKMTDKQKSLLDYALDSITIAKCSDWHNRTF